MMEKKIVLIDYQMGNIKSVEKALTYLGYPVKLSDGIEEIKEAMGVILPGVGAYRDAIKVLMEKGLDKALREVVAQNKPFLGICLGMQLLFSYSEENGLYQGLDIIPGRVVRFSQGQRIPHLGWNQLYYREKELERDCNLFSGIKNGSNFYFLHSYYCIPESEEVIKARSYYEQPFVSVVSKNRLFGVQFHPEKSSTQGLRLLKNFGEMCLAYYSSY